MRCWLALLAFAAIVCGVEDPWAKVRALKSGAELRIIKKGSAKPVMANFDQLTDEKLIVATKTEQIAISRDEIERIDARPAGAKSMKKESTTKTTDATANAGKPQYPGSTPGQTVETGTNVTFGKPDFETVYRRTATLPAPKN